MGRRALLNLGLLLLALALAVLVWLTPDAPTEDELPPLTALRADEISSLYLRLPGGDEVSLAKEGSSWMMIAPLRVPANEFRIESLLRVVETSSHGSFDAGGRDLGEYRLALPLAVLRADGTEIAFGGTSALDHWRYVRLGERIHLIEDAYYYRLQTEYPAFVSNRLLPPGSRLRAMTLPGLPLVRDEDGRWTSTLDLAPDAVNDLADAWLHAQALEVESYDAADGAPTESVHLLFEDGPDAAIEFLLVEHEFATYLARADLGLRYRFTDEQIEKLLPDPSAVLASSAERPE